MWVAVGKYEATGVLDADSKKKCLRSGAMLSRAQRETVSTSMARLNLPITHLSHTLRS